MSSAPAPEAVDILGPSGVLQALLEVPANTEISAVAVVCHPHPLHGGTMNNKVVYALAQSYKEAGAAVVRFNYRGVGGSAGGYDSGVGETEDALAVIAWMQARWPNKSLWLAGFSFGGGVALRAALRMPTARLVTVAPSAAREAASAQLPTCPWLLVQGDADEVIPADMVLNWARSLATPPEIKVLVGAGHFFHGRLTDLRDAVQQWLRAEEK